MRTTYLSLLAAGLAQLASANECEPDNCARAITGSAYGTSALLQHSIDCSSFMSITVTPAGSTVTVTEVVTAPAVTETAATVTGVVTVVATTEVSVVTEIVLTDTETASAAIATVSVPLTSVVGTKTVTETSTATYTTTCTPAKGGSGGGWGGWGGWKRDEGVTIFPTALPTYATACSSSAKYVSACSCWGITKQTVTASVPVVTYTETSTSTPTVSVTADETSTVYQTATSVETVPATTTTIYTSDYTVTVPITVSATAITTITVTATATVSKTVATTSATSATSTSSTAAATCTPSIFGGRKKDCSCQVNCGYKYTPPQGSSQYSTCSKTSTHDCADACDLKNSCITFSFNKKTGVCTLFDSLAGCTVEYGSGFSSGHFWGSC